MLLGLHGASALKVLAILGANYWIGKTTAGSVVGPAVSWAFNLGVLITNELADGYKFAALHPSLAYLVSFPALSTTARG
jgi:protein-cysteine N-palmitoyltransferase HHAT